MKLLVDAHIGRLIIGFLRDGGRDVLEASTFPPKTSDREILRRAAEESRAVMTSDKDFGALVYALAEPTIGVILLRIDVATEAERLAVVIRFWHQIERSVPGYFVVVKSKAVRRSPLPGSGLAKLD